MSQRRFVEADHVDAGVCHCDWANTANGTVRVPRRQCGLSKHRIEAAARDRELEASR